MAVAWTGREGRIGQGMTSGSRRLPRISEFQYLNSKMFLIKYCVSGSLLFGSYGAQQ
jgi:hypothetical protein